MHGQEPGPDETSQRIRSGRHEFILIDGEPLAGKTRTMTRAVQLHGGGATLLHSEVAKLADSADSPVYAALSRPDRKYFVVLDDLSAADLVLLGTSVLEALLPHTPVIANTNTAICDRLLADPSPITRPARTLLRPDGDWASRIHVPATLSAAERDTFRLKHPGVTVTTTIGDALLGGEALLRRYTTTPDKKHIDGQLLAQIAVDARRCGVHRGLSDDELRALFRARTGTRSERGFSRALDWATQAQSDTVTGLLYPYAGRHGLWRPHNHLAVADDGHRGRPRRAIPDLAWTTVLDVLPAADAYSIGIEAHLRGRPDTAAAAFTAAAMTHTGVGTAAATALRWISRNDTSWSTVWTKRTRN